MIINNGIENSTITRLQNQVKRNESYRLEYNAKSKLEKLFSKYKEPEIFKCNPKDAIDTATNIEALEKLLKAGDLKRAELVPSRTRTYDLAFYFMEENALKCKNIYKVLVNTNDMCNEPTVESKWAEDESAIIVKVFLPMSYNSTISSNLTSTYANPRPIQIYPK